MNPTIPPGAVAAIAAAIDADLERQARVQGGGAVYHSMRENDAGCAVAGMHIVVVEAARAAFSAIAEILAFDCTCFPSMEAKAVEWACRISGPKGASPFHPDPVGILLMCEEIAAAGLRDMQQAAVSATRSNEGERDAYA